VSLNDKRRWVECSCIAWTWVSGQDASDVSGLSRRRIEVEG
jgi:hypothetical protein